ncbi:MAG: carbohydrate ABC transporter permease [Ruminococcus sp.]|jgi:multiple sugar transport system permease protein|nr:carbohydrate ABC transporter permease [Ruminococcus sp.]
MIKINDIKLKVKAKIKKHLVAVLLTLLAGVSAFIFILPTVLTFTNSFMGSAEINADYGAVFATTESGGKQYIADKINLKFIPDMAGFSQYITVLFKSPDYLIKFWNSVILTGPIVIFQLATAALASYGFSRLRGKFWNTIFFIYLIIMLMPYQVTLVPNFLVADKMGLLDTRWSIILPGIFTPFAVYLVTKMMRRIPISLVEAAKLDGASEYQIFYYIFMPLTKGALASAAILVFIDNWNMVEQPLIMFTDTERYPLSVFLSQINSGEIGVAFAVAVIYMIPALLIFLYGEEYLVEGITYAGGIKG